MFLANEERLFDKGHVNSDNMKRNLLKYISVVLILACGCTSEEPYKDALSFVRTVLTDTTSIYRTNIASYDSLGRMGSIAVIGPADQTAELTEYLILCDIYDNATGREDSPDALPDFAGETFDAVIDINTPDYSVPANMEDSVPFREMIVKNVLFATSSRVSLNPYDDEKSSVKSPSKLVILSSSLCSGRCVNDIEILYSAFGKDLKIVSPIHAMVSYMSEGLQSNSIVAGVWADSRVLSSGVYTDVLHAYATDESEPLSDYITFNVDTSMTALSALEAFLDMYLDAGNTRQLQAVLLDPSTHLTVSELESAADSIIRCEEDYMIKYNGILANDFIFVDSYTSIAKACYSIMRKENCFTHKIAYPEVRAFMIMPLPRGYESSSESFRYVDFNQRYLSPETMEMIRQNAPAMAGKILL